MGDEDDADVTYEDALSRAASVYSYAQYGISEDAVSLRSLSEPDVTRDSPTETQPHPRFFDDTSSTSAPTSGPQTCTHESRFPLYLLGAENPPPDPVLDWYGALVTATTLALGTWKLVASYNSQDAAGVAVADWLMTVIMGLAYVQ